VTTAALTLCAAMTLVGCSHGTSNSLPQADPKKAASELQSGLQAQTKGDLDAAAQHYRETLKYDQKNKYALYNLALIDAAHSRYDDAENKYQVVLGIDPSYTPALFNLAILRKQKGDSAGAISLYRKLLTIKPDDAAAHMNLGLLLRATGQTSDGDTEVHKAVALDPKLKDPAVKK
jgi:tetratricopeptide (TPR) repeat protein